MVECQNCHRSIGDLETPHAFNQRVVCAECWLRLNSSANSTPTWTGLGAGWPNLNQIANLPPHKIDQARYELLIKVIVGVGVAITIAILLSGSGAGIVLGFIGGYVVFRWISRIIKWLFRVLYYVGRILFNAVLAVAERLGDGIVRINWYTDRVGRSIARRIRKRPETAILWSCAILGAIMLTAAVFIISLSFANHAQPTNLSDPTLPSPSMSSHTVPAPIAPNTTLATPTASAAPIIPPSPTSPPLIASAPPSTPPEPVSLDTMLQAYQADGTSADSAYKGKMLLLRGQILDLTNRSAHYAGDLDMACVELEGSDGIYIHALCFFQPDRADPLLHLRDGNFISIQGTCRGIAYGSAVELSDCEVVDR